MRFSSILSWSALAFLLFSEVGFGWVQIHVGDEDADPPIVSFQPATRIPITFRLSEDGAATVTDGSDLTALRNAFLAWQNVSTATISFIDDGTTTVTVADSTDGITLVTFQDPENALPAGSLAVTITTFDPTTGEISDADILFNTTRTYSTDGSANTDDIQSTAVHEVGHLLGLDHILAMSSIMYPFGGGEGDQINTDLTTDEIAGVSTIYPSSSFNGSTGSISGTVNSTVGGGNNSVFAGHVVAVDTSGRPAVTDVIDTSDGTFQIRGIPAGDYTVYVEPYDGPATAGDLFGGTFDNTFTTNFSTRFFGASADPAGGTTLTVSTGQDTPDIDITVTDATTANLTDLGTAALGSTPGLSNIPVFVQPGDQLVLDVGGTGLQAAGAIQITGTGITIANQVIENNVATMEITVSESAPTGARNLVYLDGNQNSTLTGGLIVGNTAAEDTGGTGGTVALPTPGRFQAGPGDGFVDIEWIDPDGQFTGIIVAKGTSRFPKLVVEDGAIVVDLATGEEVFRGLNGKRLTFLGLTNGTQVFVTFATFVGTEFSLFGAVASSAVANADGINCVESFFGLGDCPPGASPDGGGGGGGCFIATAVYGSPLESQVLKFRNVRDSYLAPTSLGKDFVRTYYANSPVPAGWLRRQTLLRRTVSRALLKPLLSPAWDASPGNGN